jgi:hypothetical protein
MGSSSGRLGISATHFSFATTTSVPLSPKTSPILSQVSSVVGDTTNLDITVLVGDVTSALANIQGLTGNLLSTVVAQMTSVMALVNGAAGSLPTSAVLSGVAGSVIAIAGDGTAAVKGALETGGGSVQAIAGNEGTLAGIGLSGPNALAGNMKAVASSGGHAIGNMEAAVAGSPTNIPIVTVEITPIPASRTAANNIASLLDVLNDRAKGRQKIAERESGISLEDLIFCAENPDHDSC